MNCSDVLAGVPDRRRNLGAMDFITALSYCLFKPLGGKRPSVFHLQNWAVMAKILIVLVLVILVGGAVFLATWDMPAPTATVEKVIPNDRFK
jgi:hypothetical protein